MTLLAQSLFSQAFAQASVIKAVSQTQSLLAQTFYLGANAKVQLVRFLLCLAAGLAAGVIALLYLRKARPFERALTDLFATLCIGGIFILCVEFFLDGKIELYGMVAYLIGTASIPLIFRKIKSAMEKRRKNTDDNS